MNILVYLIVYLKGQLPDIETPFLGTFSDPIIFKLHRGVFLSVLKNFRKKNFQKSKREKSRFFDFSTKNIWNSTTYSNVTWCSIFLIIYSKKSWQSPLSNDIIQQVKYFSHVTINYKFLKILSYFASIKIYKSENISKIWLLGKKIILIFLFSIKNWTKLSEQNSHRARFRYNFYGSKLSDSKK